jgi:purine-cytosine permease-like protein
MSNPFCKYKDIIGKPNTGLRKQFRIFDIAVLDTVVTILGAYLISYFSGYTFWKVLVIVFLVGIFSHRLFCVRTGLDKKLFSKSMDEYDKDK